MSVFDRFVVDPRSLLAGSASLAAATATLLPRGARGAAPTSAAREFSLVARTSLVGPPHPDTDVWAYDHRVPGPEMRVRKGERIRIRVENRLPEETTVHWRGVRVPNAMDGVPHLTQEPIGPGNTFTYEFDVPDAGTYWYHPHQHSTVQVGRGLCGALIVEESRPIDVDRDLVWVLGDWRLLDNAQISVDFDNRHDMAHNGRVGNTVTLNGKVPDTFTVRSGERVRLRLINAANARIFGLEFADNRPMIIAYDGQPVTPHEPPGGRVVIGPAMRIDLVFDMTGKPGSRSMVTDRFYRGLEYRFVDFAYAAEPLRDRPLETPISLEPNTLAEPDINGVAATGHVHDPLITLQRGRSYVLALNNETAWHHPIHLHGHFFRVISRNGRPTQNREWQDTVLMAPREKSRSPSSPTIPATGCFTATSSSIRPAG